jgi:hypothetical protein
LASEYGEYYNYSFSVNEVLSEPYGESGENGGSRLGATGDIMVYVGEDTSAMLMPGNRYLIFLSVDGGKIYTGPRMVASVDDALSIKAVPPGDNSGRLGESVFAPYSGFKIADVKALIPRVKAWQESH